MKRQIALAMVLVCLLTLCSCGWNSQKMVAAHISQNVTKIDIIHYRGGRDTSWSIEGEEIDRLREWLDSLSYKLLEVEAGQSPGDSNGSEVYTFVLTGGEWPDFSYIINGQNNCYLQSEENWFFVINPSDPPVAEPVDER